MQVRPEPEAEAQLPGAWEPPDLELRILASPRPGPRDMRWYFGGVLALFFVMVAVGPYLLEHPRQPLPGALRSQENVPSALRPYYDRALAGDASAMRTLGSMFCTGQDVPRDTEAGICWYRLAATAGDQDALKDLEKLRPYPQM
jgi:TPR repeat protein